jgi:hypothetical protein
MAIDGIRWLPDPKHTMIFKRCMGAKPSREYLLTLLANDLEGLL